MDIAPKVEKQAKTEVYIHDYHVHPQTGHVTVHLKTKTVAGNSSWFGPVKQYGCDIQMLRDRFNGDIDQFEAWASREHKSLTGPPPGLVQALTKRKGKVIA